MLALLRNFPNLKQYIPKYYSTFRVISSHNKFLKCSIISHVNQSCGSRRSVMISAANHNDQESTKIGEYDTLTEYHAYDMIHKLSDNDRAFLSKALSRYNSEKTKSKFQGTFLFAIVIIFLIKNFKKENSKNSNTYICVSVH